MVRDSGYISLDCSISKSSGLQIIKIPNGSFATDGHLNIVARSIDGKVINNASLAGNPAKAEDFNAGKELFLDVNHDVLENDYFTDIQERYSGSVGCLASFGSSKHNFGHWFTDTLPKLSILWNLYPRHFFDKYYFPSFQKPWQIQTAYLLSIPEEKIIDGTDISRFACDELYCTSFPRPNWDIPLWIPAAVKSLFPDLKTSYKPGPKIYISRRDSTTRRPTNEDQLTRALTKHGYREIVMSELSLRDQISAFINAESIISLHSSSLALTMFSQPECNVLEIFGPGQVSNLHRDIANANYLSYQSMVFSNSAFACNNNQVNLNLVNFHVDIEYLIDSLKCL